MLDKTSPYALRRARMVERLRLMGIKNEHVLDAMHHTPRHVFVEEALRSRAYDDLSLPLGSGQTISQPYTVAKMTELLCGNALLVSGESSNMPQKVLEIGTGCGYQTAVLEHIGIREIYSIERIRDLHEVAKRNLRTARCVRSRLKCGDGYLGLSSAAPFNGIIVTAAPKEVPLALLNQLAIGGRMVLPLDEGGKQFLWLIEKLHNGFQESCIQEANFVPLINGCRD